MPSWFGHLTLVLVTAYACIDGGIGHLVGFGTGLAIMLVGVGVGMLDVGVGVGMLPGCHG